MMDLTTVIEHYQAGFRQQYASKLTRDQHRALNAVLACRSERYGEMVLNCPACDGQQTRFHSCGYCFSTCYRLDSGVPGTTVSCMAMPGRHCGLFKEYYRFGWCHRRLDNGSPFCAATVRRRCRLLVSGPQIGVQVSPTV